MVTIPAGNVKEIQQDFTTFKTSLIYLVGKAVLAGSFIDFFYDRPPPVGLRRNSLRPMFVGLSLFLMHAPPGARGADGLPPAGLPNDPTMLRIDLAPLGEGVHTVMLNPEPEAVGLDPDRFADLRVAASLDLFNDRVLVTLEATATATLDCDRTLAVFEQPVAGTYRILFVPPSFARRDDDETLYEEVRVLEDATGMIDVTDAVRDTVLLAVPARKVAPGAEDAAIQTVFGAPAGGDEAAIDPRWEALRSLQTGDKP